MIDQNHIFKNNNSNGNKLKLAQGNTSSLQSMNNSSNSYKNKYSQLEGYTETNTFCLSHSRLHSHEMENNKYDNTKSKYISATLASLHANNFGLNNLSNSSINNIDLDLNGNDVICYTLILKFVHHQ